MTKGQVSRKFIRTEELTGNAYSLFQLLGELDRAGLDLKDMYVTCREGWDFQRVHIVETTLTDLSTTHDIALD